LLGPIHEQVLVLLRLSIKPLGDAARMGPEDMNRQVQGVTATAKGKFFYCEQWGDNLLALRDDAGGLRVLQTAP
jgi:hypothetical protein